jgi:hypothetical protein
LLACKNKYNWFFILFYGRVSFFASALSLHAFGEAFNPSLAFIDIAIGAIIITLSPEGNAK